jgi:hypothetical protein
MDLSDDASSVIIAISFIIDLLLVKGLFNILTQDICSLGGVVPGFSV